MKTNPDEAKALFREYTSGNIDRLWGRANLPRRQAILTALRGKKATQADAGWFKFRQAMLVLYEVGGDCQAAEHCNLCEAVKASW